LIINIYKMKHNLRKLHKNNSKLVNKIIYMMHLKINKKKKQSKNNYNLLLIKKI